MQASSFPSLRRRGRIAAGAFIFAALAAVGPQLALAAEPIVYTIRVTAPETHYLEVRAVYPTKGRDVFDLMMPIWSPGFYRVENYASRVEDLFARAAGTEKGLEVERPQLNRWRIHVKGTDHVEVT